MPALLERSTPRGCLVGALLLAGATGAIAQDLTVPKRYQSLYASLAQRIERFAAPLPRPVPEPPLLRAALLTSAACERAQNLASEARWRDVLTELDALRRIGAQAIVLDICDPLLTPAFADPRPLLERYANLANEVRQREMRLLVRHGSLPPGNGAVQGARYYQHMTPQRLFQERLEEAKSIVVAVQPDDLTLASRPQADAIGMRVSPREWRNHMQRSASALRSAFGDFAPPLGAGSGVWDDPGYVEAFAGIAGIAYIDLSFYPVTVGQEDLLERMLAWPRRIRGIDPQKRIVVSGAWLSKATAKEPWRNEPEPDALAREAFSFWSPLDVNFLRTLAQCARAEQIELLGVSRPRYFFAYLDFFDPQTYKANARLLEELAAQRAAGAMERGGLTDTGRAFGGL